MKRVYFDQLIEYLQYFPVVAILGARQTGKTTLLSFLDKKWKIFDLEKVRDYDLIASDPELFLRLNNKFIAIDEAQRLPEIFPALRVAIDKDRSEPGRFIITGSSSQKLSKSISESLAGRVGIIEISPFTYNEIVGSYKSELLSCISNKGDPREIVNNLKKKSEIDVFYNYLLFGGYPEPFLKKSDRFHSLWMDNYIKTYLERDLAKLFPGIDNNRFRMFLRTLASLSGSIINYSKVAVAISVSQPTIRDYFEIAHETFLWRKIPAFVKDSLKRVVKHGKGYYRDSGLVNHLLRISDQGSLISHPKIGELWEGLVIEEIIRGLNVLGKSFDYFYYCTSGGAEVDLVLEGDFGIVPIEIKHSRKLDNKNLRGLIDFIEEKSCNFGLVITNDEAPRLISEEIINIPFNYL